jgi:hypothetical protein
LSPLARSSGAFSIAMASNAPLRRLPPFISGGAKAGVAAKHLSIPSMWSLLAVADGAEAEGQKKSGSWRGQGGGLTRLTRVAGVSESGMEWWRDWRGDGRKRRAPWDRVVSAFSAPCRPAFEVEVPRQGRGWVGRLA